MNDTVLNVFRHEIKYVMSWAEYARLKQILCQLMQLDGNMKSGQDYYIRSLYFDTIDNMDYYTKVYGMNERKKIRFRIYDCNAQWVKLEIKNKKDNRQLKETAQISREDALQIIDGNIEVLSKYHDKVSQRTRLLFEQYMYQPKIIIDYNREAYFLPIENIRLTFDKRIRTAPETDIFNDRLAMYSVMPENVVVLEVKYDKYLPDYLSNILATVNMQNMAVSKYCMARERLS